MYQYVHTNHPYPIDVFFSALNASIYIFNMPNCCISFRSTVGMFPHPKHKRKHEFIFQYNNEIWLMSLVYLTLCEFNIMKKKKICMRMRQTKKAVRIILPCLWGLLRRFVTRIQYFRWWYSPGCYPILDGLLYIISVRVPLISYISIQSSNQVFSTCHHQKNNTTN